jgi:hypothetical protein
LTKDSSAMKNKLSVGNLKYIIEEEDQEGAGGT